MKINSVIRHSMFSLLFIFIALPIHALEERGVNSLRQSSKAFAAVAREVSPSVVFIQVEAKITGRDPQSDVAVIEIKNSNKPTVKLGDSSELEVGEWVVAIGNPFELSHTLTVGVVSAKGRTCIGINDYEDFIQTDAAINPKECQKCAYS